MVETWTGKSIILEDPLEAKKQTAVAQFTSGQSGEKAPFGSHGARQRNSRRANEVHLDGLQHAVGGEIQTAAEGYTECCAQ